MHCDHAAMHRHRCCTRTGQRLHMLLILPEVCEVIVHYQEDVEMCAAMHRHMLLCLQFKRDGHEPDIKQRDGNIRIAYERTLACTSWPAHRTANLRKPYACQALRCMHANPLPLTNTVGGPHMERRLLCFIKVLLLQELTCMTQHRSEKWAVYRSCHARHQGDNALSTVLLQHARLGRRDFIL
jgi:hypothetical protein